MLNFQYDNLGTTEHRPIGEILDGMAPARMRVHESRVYDAARLWLDCIEGRQDPFLLKQAMNPTSGLAWSMLCKEYPSAFREVMTTSDFTALTADVLDRELLGFFTDVPIPNMGVVKKKQLRDFRNRKLFTEDGMATVFEKLGEHEVHKQKVFTEGTPITYYPDVYAAGAKVSWRAIMNDDLGVFNEIPARLAMGARRTIHKFISGLYTDANGPHASLFAAAFTNLITTTYGASTNNPPLSAGGLSDAFTVLMRQTDPGGDPILIPGNMFLIVGPGLYVTAKNLMNMLTVDVTVEGGTKDGVAPTTAYPSRKVRVNNWLVGGLTLIEDPYMRIIASSAAGNIKDTMWMIIQDPAAQGRPALEYGGLVGYDTPQLFSKTPNTQRVGGGGADPLLGDFFTMATEFKSIVAFGGVQVDGRSAVASTGAGA